jgi:hypothetical protein
VLPMARLQQPTRTKAFYRQLFDAGSNYTQEFITCASETLAWWLEVSFDDLLHAEPGLCHNNLPAFDMISILESPERPSGKVPGRGSMRAWPLSDCIRQT